MNWRKPFEQVRNRIGRSWRKARIRDFEPRRVVRSLLDSFNDEWMERAFQNAREKQAPEIDRLPVDFKLRQSSLPRRMYEAVFPVSHAVRVSYRHEGEFFEDFMPLSAESYIGRGSYKFVYRLPWQMVVKVSKEILPADPIIGSTFREVADNLDNFLKPDEIAFVEHLKRGRGRTARERLDFKFFRLGMERYHYWKVREALPDLVLPTRFFMGMRFRRLPLPHTFVSKLTPMDSQILLVGKHLKEFARAGRRADQGKLRARFFPRYDFDFDIGRFGQIKKKVLLKITEDFERLIAFTRLLAEREKLILDIHTENIIITLPEFQLKIFDFHLFDEHLYEPSLKHDSPEQDHIEVIERFIESFGLERPA